MISVYLLSNKGDISNQWWKGGDRDGRVGGCGTHISPRTHQKYNYMWNNSHWKLTGDWQKDCCTTKPVGKLHTESGRKGRERVRLGPALLGEVSEEKGDYTGGDLPWEWVVQATYWAPWPWGPTPGRQARLPGWRAGGTNRRAVGSLDATCEECTNACSWSRVETVDWDGIPLPLHVPQPEMSDSSRHLHHDTTLH